MEKEGKSLYIKGNYVWLSTIMAVDTSITKFNAINWNLDKVLDVRLIIILGVSSVVLLGLRKRTGLENIVKQEGAGPRPEGGPEGGAGGAAGGSGAGGNGDDDEDEE